MFFLHYVFWDVDEVSVKFHSKSKTNGFVTAHTHANCQTTCDTRFCVHVWPTLDLASHDQYQDLLASLVLSVRNGFFLSFFFFRPPVRLGKLVKIFEHLSKFSEEKLHFTKKFWVMSERASQKNFTRASQRKSQSKKDIALDLGMIILTNHVCRWKLLEIYGFASVRTFVRWWS